MQGIKEENGVKSVLVGGEYVSLAEGAATGRNDALATLKPWRADDDSEYMASLRAAVASSPELFQEYIDSYTSGDSGEAIQDE